LADENPDWDAPKIHGELQKLGFVVSERSVARYLVQDGNRRLDVYGAFDGGAMPGDVG
jgi:hypothetical protein